MADQATRIRISYRAVDGFTARGTFATMAGAQRFAQRWVGETPEMGSSYAVSGDGVGTITAEGAPLLDLFPKLRAAAEAEGERLEAESYYRDPGNLRRIHEDMEAERYRF